MTLGTGRRAALFCMPEDGHFQRLAPLIRDLARNGVAPHVFSDQKFSSRVEAAGGTFHDLFSKYPLELADRESSPIPCRFVTFAATYATQICRDVESIAPSIVMHDSFAVIGSVVATALGLPRVNICAGHNVVPERFVAVLETDPRVRISPQCFRAVELLRDEFGMEDASPFSYVSSMSPDLNLYCEPPEFLEQDERRPFEPIAFYGCLPSPEQESYKSEGRISLFGPASDRKLKVYVSFGTVVWRYYAGIALRALTTLADTFASVEEIHAVIGLGGADLDRETLAQLSKPNVAVESYVDQWGILQEADVFFTHHGLNSTHEAIFHRVPMVSYPFFWDQPELACKCQRLGLAIGLVDTPQAGFGSTDVHAALTRLASQKETIATALARVRDWEMAVIDNRPAVLRRVMELMG